MRKKGGGGKGKYMIFNIEYNFLYLIGKKKNLSNSILIFNIYILIFLNKKQKKIQDIRI